ncbi:AAA family ATPase [Bradyrhizobium sp. 187]|uniref:AAA family ATPase n=1 Tax=Bradyrhizobium sp. 187 TaxID=2782655 RepID=UPI00200040A3|nr:AAA family ATPase [Bradyrhizobium sp. 187]UPJ74103.1 AAA family ATPase [Bradyrhizobium sp. 187]
MLIANIGKLRNAGILADRSAKSPSVCFRRFNLIYGFNGSGKSTLSRCFAAMQANSSGGHLPEACEFEFSTDSGETVRAGAGNALSGRLAVFNEDFISLNFQWLAGKARPVFYIGKEQAEAAADLRKTEAAIPVAIERKAGAERLVRAKEQQLATFKREHARLVSQEIRPANRKYEAPQLTVDYSSLDLGAGAKLDGSRLANERELCRREEAMPELPALDYDKATAISALEAAIGLLRETPSLTTISELETHSEMLRWVQEGTDYHVRHRLDTCLLCSGSLSPARKELLARALDEGFERFQKALDVAKEALEGERSRYLRLALSVSSSKDVVADRRDVYDTASVRAKEALSGAVAKVFEPAISAIEMKLARPTSKLDGSVTAWSDAHLIHEMFALVDSWLGVLNLNIAKHNEACATFAQKQEDARLALRRHHLAEKYQEYKSACDAVENAESEVKAATIELNQLQNRARDLSGQVKEHGQAAAMINRLIESYLGHKELSIVSVDGGYEIHRRARPIEGNPSEGEKTAIALCYFLSTLEADGRSVKDRIVVVDDPISSLDSRALNYACSLLLSRLGDAAQVFVLTHNQSCMNEFKKSWSRLHRPRNAATPASATLLFLDVKVPKEEGSRSTTIVEMSRLLREYDSEYHYLVDHVLKFHSSEGAEYEYAYMMPNVLRRVLDVFLAFRCPGSAGFASKMEQLRKDHEALDSERVAALERLVQLESHSDSLDDLIGFSSLTLEESRAAAAAVVGLMETVDRNHLAALRRLCR